MTAALIESADTIVSANAAPPPRRTVAVVAPREAEITAALEWLGDMLGIAFRRTTRRDAAANTGPTIEYGQAPLSPRSLWIPQRRYDAAYPPPMSASAELSRNSLNFDLFDAIRFWFSDAAHAQLHAEAHDAHERLPYANTIFSTHGLPAAPIVNSYIAEFRAALSHHLRIPSTPMWPDGKKACVVLSHDVDDPLDPTIPATVRQIARIDGESQWGALRASLACRWSRCASRTRETRDRHWLFDEIMEAESRFGFRSTFFFATRHRGMAHADRAFDVRYDAASRPFRRLFGRLTANRFEIALHTSYNVCRNRELLTQERALLESLAKTRIRGVRHHYWHLSRPFWPMLTAHGDADIEYDASLAFNESPGFRFGVALPFRPIEPNSNRAVTTWQIPTMLMDGAIFYRPGATADDGIRIASEWIDTLVAARGLGAIDWHVRTSYPGNRRFAEWGRAYLGILDMLAARGDVWVTNCAGAMDYLAARRLNSIA